MGQAGKNRACVLVLSPPVHIGLLAKESSKSQFLNPKSFQDFYSVPILMEETLRPGTLRMATLSFLPVCPGLVDISMTGGGGASRHQAIALLGALRPAFQDG